MNHSRPVRQIDIAQYLGVSRSAVACALSQRSGPRRYRLKEETEELIKKTAADLGYKPSFLGLSLRHRKSFLTGLLNRAVNSWVNSELNDGIQEVLIEKNYAPVVFTVNNLLAEKKYLETCIERNVEGLLVNCMVGADGRTNADQFARLYRDGLPLVEMFGRCIPGVPSVEIDYAATGALAVEKLWKMGHRRIAVYIHDRYQEGGKKRTYWTTNDLYLGYSAAAKERGLEPCVITYPLAKDLVSVDALYQAAFLAADRALSHAMQPTGFVVESAPYAAALLDYVLLRQPSRNTEIHAVCLGAPQLVFRPTSNLTLLGNPARKVGITAARLLMQMVQDKADGKKLGRYSNVRIAPED